MATLNVERSSRRVLSAVGEGHRLGDVPARVQQLEYFGRHELRALRETGAEVSDRRLPERRATAGIVGAAGRAAVRPRRAGPPQLAASPVPQVEDAPFHPIRAVGL